MNIIIKIKILLIIFFAGAILLLTSCFKEDKPIFPPSPGDQTVYAFQNSIYDYQSYFDFGTDSTVASIANDSWQIEFGCSPASWDVRVNSSAYYKVYPTGDTAFNGIVSVTDPLQYIFDTSNGNPDSCAFAGWLNRGGAQPVPTGEVFLVGLFDGIKMKPKWKIRIEAVDDTSFSFIYAAFPSGTLKPIRIAKDATRNYIQFDLAGGSVVNSEPPADSYDLLFSQYGTILYDNTGVPTPYFVRGILLNPDKVEAYLDTLHAFDDINYDLIKDMPFSNTRDIIGHTWKDVKVDQGTNTAVYFVNTKLNWLIKDTEGFIYKMKFIEYYKPPAQVGYTTIEFQRL